MLLIEHAILTWLHLLAASIWVGGTLFIAIVLNPVLKQEMQDSARLNIITKVGKRFNKVAVPVVAVLLSTGVYKALLLPSTLYLTTYGIILTVKISVVISMLIVWFIHARISNRMINSSSDSMEHGTTLRVRARAVMLGKILAIQAVTVIFLAALLDSF
jgi:Predicted integral membrane protein